MIAFPRRVARRFRAACAKCTSGRPRGPAPPVVLRQTDGRVTLLAAFPEVVLELACASPVRGRAEVLVAPAAALEAVAADSDESVVFEAGADLAGVARWDGRAPGSVPVTFLLPGKQHDPPPRPETTPVAGALLAALHEAGRAAARDDGRFALSRFQVRGAKGQVAGTDGKVAVLFSGFTLPFAGDVLVSAVPLFGCPEVRGESGVWVGRTDAHLVVSAGDWTAWLAVAPAGKFPDVAAAVPRPAPTTVTLDPSDAAGLLRQLPKLPGREHDHRPVTLCADGVLAVRAADAGAVEEVVLARSPVTGPAVRVAVDRRALGRVLALGCTALRVSPDKALVGTGDGVTVLAALLDPDLAVEPRGPARGQNSPTPKSDPTPTPRSTTTVKPHETNGHAVGGRHDPPAGDVPDPLVAAEELRAALADAAVKAARLVAALRQSKREQKALSAVLASLKQLNLDAGGLR